MLKIEFKKSRSALFPDAVKTAKGFTSYTESFGVHSVELSGDDIFNSWGNFARLHNIVTKWTTCNVYFMGKLINPYSNQLFYTLQEIVQCANTRPGHLCKLPSGLEGWGCSMLNSISRHLNCYPYVYWYSFGHFSTDMKYWFIDKDALTGALMRKVKEKRLDVCPHFDWYITEQIINSLPDMILIDGVNWQVQYRRDFIGSRIMNIPFSIKHIEPESVNIFKALESCNDEIDEMSEDEINRLIEEKRRKSI